MDNFTQSALGGNFSLSNPVVAVGTSQASGGAINTTVTLDYSIDGLLYSKTAITSGTVAAANAASAVNMAVPTASTYTTICLYLLQINAAGVITAVKGQEVKSTDLSTSATTSGNAVLQFPRALDGNTPFGFLQVTVASTAALFQINLTGASTTSLTATGITTYYRSLFAVPSAPLAIALTS